MRPGTATEDKHSQVGTGLRAGGLDTGLPCPSELSPQASHLTSPSLSFPINKRWNNATYFIHYHKD